MGQIRKATETGASNQLVHQPAAGLNTNLAVDPVGRKVYWNQNAGTRILRVDLDGSNLEAVLAFAETGCFPAACSPQGIDKDSVGGFVYWADAGNNVVRRKSTTLPATLTTIVTLTTAADSLELDVPNDRVFIFNGVGGLEEGVLSSPPNAAVGLAPGPFNTTGEGIALDEGNDVLYMLSGGKIVSCPASDCDELSDLSDFYVFPSIGANGLAFLPEPVAPVPALSPIGVSALVMILGLAGFAYSRRATRLGL